jgi:hypothetical protein
MLMEEAILTLQILMTNSGSHFQKTVIPQEIKIKIPNLKPQIPQISQIGGEGKTVSTNYILVPEAFLQQITPKSLVSVICGICGLPLIFGFRVEAMNYMQNLSTGISLVILSAGFSLLGILSFLNRHHDAEAVSLCLNNGFSVAGSIVSLLTGAAFLFAACLYWSRYSGIRVA